MWDGERSEEIQTPRSLCRLTDGMGMGPSAVGRWNVIWEEEKKDMETVFCGLIGRQFSVAHLLKTSIADWRAWGSVLQIFKSSAYSRTETSFGKREGRELMKIMNNVGPRTDP